MNFVLNLILIGLMGVGKICIGCCLVECFMLDFVDVDQVIVEVIGVSILVLFEYVGEVGFCQYECQVLQVLLIGCNQLVFIGGGVVLDLDNCVVIVWCGFVVYLWVSVLVQFECLVCDCGCLLLQCLDCEQVLYEMVVLCDLLYCGLVDFILDIDFYIFVEVIVQLVLCLVV